MTKQDWSIEWPKEEGNYWFYGWPYGRSEPSDLYYVKVIHDRNKNPVYITSGFFLYKSEGAEGLWLKVRLPKLPQLY